MLLRAAYGKLNPWIIVRRFLSKHLPLFSRIRKSVCDMLRVVMNYLQIPASYLRLLAVDYELAIRKDSYEKLVNLNKESRLSSD